MRILAVSDLHDSKQQVEKLAQEAVDKDVDLVLIAGDLSEFGELSHGMIGPFLERGKKVAFVAGNHDMPGTAETIEEKYKIPDVQKHSVIYDDIGIFGCGGANIVGMNFHTEDEISYYINAGYRYIKSAKKKILLTPIHPKGSIIEKSSFPGSKAVTKAIYELKPDLHICGHIHEMEGFEEKMGKTKVICVGARGTIIDI